MGDFIDVCQWILLVVIALMALIGISGIVATEFLREFNRRKELRRDHRYIP